LKYVAEVRLRFGSSPAFTLADLKVFLGNKGISRGYLSLLVHNLLASGEVKRIARGTFTFRDDAQLAGFGFRPFYYGLQDALSLRNLWEQETNPVVITPRKARPGVRSFCGRNYVVRRIARGMFVGFSMLRYGDIWIPVSDPEKTLIDFAYFREPLDAGSLAELSHHIDRKRLGEYLARCPAWARKRVERLLAGK